MIGGSRAFRAAAPSSASPHWRNGSFALDHPVELQPLSDPEFAKFRSLLAELAGIHLGPNKKVMVAGRLSKRLRAESCPSYGAYLSRLRTDERERQVVIDLLTTNETFFFREPKHFAFLAEKVLPAVQPGRPFRVWSAACSTGEEPYSIAMVLATHLKERPWEVVASDLSLRVLETARKGVYPIERAEKIPSAYLKAYCLKGTGQNAGTFMVTTALRGRVQLHQINLSGPLPDVGAFDVIFLRNVMIYFSAETKKRVCAQLAAQLRPGGHLFIGHSESLNGISESLRVIQPSVYRAV